MPTAEEFAALQKALAHATAQQQEAADRHAALIGELRITRAERDLLKEQLNKFKRQLFAAKSEASAAPSAMTTSKKRPYLSTDR